MSALWDIYKNLTTQEIADAVVIVTDPAIIQKDMEMGRVLRLTGQEQVTESTLSLAAEQQETASMRQHCPQTVTA
jgi:hypothetical protein